VACVRACAIMEAAPAEWPSQPTAATRVRRARGDRRPADTRPACPFPREVEIGDAPTAALFLPKRLGLWVLLLMIRAE
jgi:hypothetical protein